jgi:transcriptional regulator with XRE-family HTH domain
MVQGTVLFREALGDVLRQERVRLGLTLRELSGRARISLGYISEVERGQKEASSELLASLCDALDVSLASVLRDVSETIAVVEAPITLPVHSASDVVASAA